MLAVAGVEDPVTTPAVLRRIASGVQIGRSVVLDGVAHLAPAESPDRVADLIVEHTGVGVTAHHRQSADAEWTVTPLVAGELLALPELGIEVPLADLYEGTGLPETEPDDGR